MTSTSLAVSGGIVLVVIYNLWCVASPAGMRDHINAQRQLEPQQHNDSIKQYLYVGVQTLFYDLHFFSVFGWTLGSSYYSFHHVLAQARACVSIE